MNDETLIIRVFDWFTLNAEPLIFTATVAVVYFALNILIARFLRRAESGDVRSGAALTGTRAVRSVTGFFAVLTILVVWGIDFASVAIFATTTITLLGVALFASWSILSNVTAYFVLQFHPTFSRGTFVRIIDGDNYVEGYVSDLSLLSIQLVAEDKSVIVYPNNLLLGRVAIVEPADRLNGVGKIVNPPPAGTSNELAHPPTA